MFLKSIDISGFKSFARPTRFEIPAGITALVGPNGSGKSNVVDAIRWCLGEQSMRDLRGQRSEDVIHSGARRSLGSAEVHLTFTGEIDSEGDTVTGRRLYRSGESEYLVDGRRVRLRDLQDSVRQIGIDGSQYVVVNQGMTDALLSATPAERRAVLEQAAGLSAYRTRRDEAQQKLSATARNVLTIESVLAELEPRLRTLRRQARAVQERDEARARLGERLALWYACRYADLCQRLAALGAQIADVSANRTSVESEVYELEGATDMAMNTERAWQIDLAECVSALHAAQREHDAARFSAREDRRQLDAVRTQARDLRLLGQRLDNDLAASRSRQSEILARLETIHGQHVKARATQEQANGELRMARLELERFETARQSLEAQQAPAESELRAVQASRQHEIRDLEVGEKATVEASRGREELTALLTEAGRKATMLATDLVAARVEEEQLIASHKEAEQALYTAKQRLQRLESIRSRCQARLREMERRRVQLERLMTSAGQEMAGSPLVELRALPGWEQAIASAIGSWATPGALHAGSAAAQTNAEGIQPWRDRLNAAHHPLLWAGSVVSGWPSHTANPLAVTVLVETDVQAREVWDAVRHVPALLTGSPSLQIVTRLGAVHSALGIQNVGDRAHAVRYLHFRNEAAAIDRALDHVRLRDARLSATIENYTHQVSECNADPQVAAENRRRSTARRRELEDANEDVRRRIRQAQVEHDQASSRLDRLTTEAEAGTFRLRAAEQRLAQLEGNLAEQLPQLADARRQSAVATARIQGCLDKRNAAQSAMESAVARLNGEVAARRVIERELARLEMDAKQLDERAPKVVAEAVRLESELNGQEQRLAECEQEVQRREVEVENRRAARPSAETAATGLVAARGRLAAAVSAHERLLVRADSLQSDIDSPRGEIIREMGVEADNLPPAVGPAPDGDELRRLRARANQFPDADLGVIQECAELDQRYSRLRDHLDDLQVASVNLGKIMQLADREMRQRFGVAFDAVNAEFGRVFEVMLRGGSASLEQMDEHGGIGIRAQLPGKRMHASSAFSGGERALIASSLLFGVLRIRPTPFCVLDEVDAALDEGNVDRYLAALRDLSERTQIIVVTHNRATMGAADALYGMTMDREGVSSVLSLRLDDYEAAV
ncbi:MAG: chromosome segregation protein SMC [Chloroflexota bacterium]